MKLCIKEWSPITLCWLSLVNTFCRSLNPLFTEYDSFVYLAFTILNSVPNGKILEWFRLKAFADYKIKVLEIMTFVFDRIENNVGKGENGGYQHFLLFPQCFQKAFYSRSLKIGIVW